MKKQAAIALLTDHLIDSHLASRVDGDLQTVIHLAKLDASEILDFLEGIGMEPPTLDHDKCQKLYKKYIEPNVNMWDEEFDKMAL